LSKNQKRFALPHESLFFACAKKSNQKKAPPAFAPAAAQRVRADDGDFLAVRPCTVRKRRASCAPPFGFFPVICAAAEGPQKQQQPDKVRDMNWRRLFAVMQKEVRQLRRDRISLGMILGIPVMQLILFGYAINLNLRGLTAGIADQANTAASRALVMDMVASGVIAPKLAATSPQQLTDALRRGQISIGVVIPPDFEARRFDGREAVQVLVDGSDTVVQSAAVQLAQLPLDTTPTANTRPLNLSKGQISVVSFYNPQRRSAVNIVPGLIGVILTMTMVLFTGVAIVRERERGNMELLIVTPISRTELMIGKVVPYVLIGLLQATLVLGLGMWLFNVPIAGSVGDVYAASMLLIVANLSLGLLISTAAQSQFQAMQMTMFVFLPSILLSGFMFPLAGMPKVAQWIAEILPLTHFLRLIRGIMLRGAGLLELWPDVLALLVFVAVMMTTAILRFHKRLD
jgi:ABC-2 type transport system permease protein